MPKGDAIKMYPMLSDALTACSKDDRCDAILDVNCDQSMYWTFTEVPGNCTEKVLWYDSSQKECSCAWQKGKYIEH